MTFREANRFVRTWKARLAPEWTLEVVSGPSPNWEANAHKASIDPADDYLHATLYTHQTTDGSLDERESKRVLLHELLHLTVNDLEHAANEAAKGLGHDGQKLAQKTIEHHAERLVDRLSDVLVDT